MALWCPLARVRVMYKTVNHVTVSIVLSKLKPIRSHKSFISTSVLRLVPASHVTHSGFVNCNKNEEDLNIVHRGEWL